MALPGEHVIKDTGMFPVTWTKGTFSNINGKLILTSQRLIFTAGRFQDVISAIRGAHKNRADIPLATVTGVEKGFMATITVHAGGVKYTFKGMRDAGGWITAINQARITSVARSAFGAPQQRVQPPPQQQASAFCGQCGAPVPPGNKFCGKCGAPV